MSREMSASLLSGLAELRLQSPKYENIKCFIKSSKALTFLLQVILKANNLDAKHVWVKKIRQLIQDTYFGTSKVSASLPSLTVPHHNGSNRSSKYTTSQRSSRDMDDVGSLDESIENVERGSLASFGSGGTTDSESHHRVSKEHARDGDNQESEAMGNLKRLVDETLTLS